MILLLPFVAALALALVFVPACRWLGRRHGCVACPASDRWHGRTVPLLGGVAIFAAVAVGLLTLPGAPGPSVVFGGAALLFLLGLIDDLRHLNATTKLVVQFAVAGGLLFLDAGAHWTGWPVADAALTMLWVVGITNAFNLIDNMDGLCAGVTLIAGTAWLGILLAAEPSAAHAADAWYLALLLGAVAGFLVYNRRPASIFMGDAGSLFLGASVAGLTLGPGAASGPAPSLAVAAPLLVALVPLLDTALVTVTRTLNARPVVAGGRDHTSHRLVASGLSEPQTLAVLWSLAAVSGGVAWLVATQDADWPLPVASACVIAAALLGIRLAHVDPPDVFGGRGEPSPVMLPAARPGAGHGAEVVLDFCLIVVVYQATYHLRFDAAAFPANQAYLLRSLPIVAVCQLAALWVAGAYGTSWRRFDFAGTAPLVQGVAGGAIAAQFVLLYLDRFVGYSRLVFVYDALLLLATLAAARSAVRFAAEHWRGRLPAATERIAFHAVEDSDREAFREFIAQGRERYRVVAGGDDEPAARGSAGADDLGHLVDLVHAGKVDAVAVGTGPAGAMVIDVLRPVCERQDVRFFSIGLAPVGFRAPAAGEAAPRAVVTFNLRDLAGRGAPRARRKRPAAGGGE